MNGPAVHAKESAIVRQTRFVEGRIRRKARTRRMIADIVVTRKGQHFRSASSQPEGCAEPQGCAESDGCPDSDGCAIERPDKPIVSMKALESGAARDTA
jgi:hypothetical protein